METTVVGREAEKPRGWQFGAHGRTLTALVPVLGLALEHDSEVVENTVSSFITEWKNGKRQDDSSRERVARAGIGQSRDCKSAMSGPLPLTQ